jgi:hypothetical protein
VATRSWVRVTVAFHRSDTGYLLRTRRLGETYALRDAQADARSLDARGGEEPTVGVLHVSTSEIPDDRSAIERDGFAVAVQRGEPPVGWGAWHHHGDHHVVAYVLVGLSTSTRVPPGTGPSRPRPATSSTSNPRPFIESDTAREILRWWASTSAPGSVAWTSTDLIVVEDA